MFFKLNSHGGDLLLDNSANEVGESRHIKDVCHSNEIKIQGWRVEEVVLDSTNEWDLIYERLEDQSKCPTYLIYARLENAKTQFLL